MFLILIFYRLIFYIEKYNLLIFLRELHKNKSLTYRVCAVEFSLKWSVHIDIAK